MHPAMGDPGIIGDQQIALAQKCRQVGKLAIQQTGCAGPLARLQDQQPGLPALGGRVGGDELIREFEMETGHLGGWGRWLGMVRFHAGIFISI